MNRIARILMFFSFILILTSGTMAGVVIQGVEMSGENVKNQSTVYMEADKMRIEANDDGNTTMIIFRNDKGLLWIINEKDKSYMEMTKEDVAKMKEQIDQAMAQMQEQMKNLPPEQREMMKKMMPGNMMQQMKPKVVYQKKKSGVKVKNWSSTHYEGVVEGTKKYDVWTIDWAQAGINEKDMSGMRAMGQFFEALSGQIDEFYKMGSEQFEKEGGYAGIPIKFISYTGNTVTSNFEITDIKKQDINDSLFELPSGYEKRDQPFEGMGR